MLGGTTCWGVSGLPRADAWAKGVCGMLGMACLSGKPESEPFCDRERAN